ncbi:uncharacterized protein LOC100876311 [Megachile rotundata]|uniref:uncharacterized protein LOC100876311 n=1 Tax=Megachile rotundata TaxID=143995 RepID=UPI003FCF8142
MNANKRQKLPATRCEQREKSLEDLSLVKEERAYALDTLPAEVLEMILRLLPLRDVAASVRLVSRHCSRVAATVLNGAFLAAGARLEKLAKRIEGTVKNAKTNPELVARSKALNALELIKAQYKMLRAVTWRYTHPPSKQRAFPRLCFYAGSLLDDLDELLARIGKFHASIVDPRTTDSSIGSFVTVSKRFMNFFEKLSERRVNRSALISGCKVVDVLDCLIEGRQVSSFKVMPNKRGTGRIVDMKLKYVLKRGWFTCLEVRKNAEENCWRDEQRFMYLRLRRLVGSVNEHLFENLHYEHELMLQIPLTLPLRPPPASTYSGYGEYGGRFFYYGNMNKYAYESKFLNAVSAANRTVETEQPVRRPPSFDLVIEIELRCTPELAPLAVRTQLKSDRFDSWLPRTSKTQRLYLKMNVACPASIANRLPGNFLWELRSPR